MKKLILACMALALLPCSNAALAAQDENDSIQNIIRVLKEKEPEWQCVKRRSGERGLDSPHGDFYNFECKHEHQTLSWTIFYGDTKQDAVKMLERSQMMLQINESRPLEGIGEQAYVYAGHGGAWITFRKENLFVQVDVGLVDTRTIADPSPEMDTFTNQALELIKHFAQNIAQSE